MPSASGVYTLPSGYLAVTGMPILASQHNPPLEDIAVALTGRLSRDGSAPMTGPLKNPDGSAALPSFTFATDSTTGAYKTTNGMGVAVGGVQVAEFTSAGLASGVWRPGMLLPWTLSAVPNSLWVLPVGQTLSRTAYPTLWTAAQAEIAAGNAFFNNGNGSTTFGIGDLRGRVIAALDTMGGVDAGRLVGGIMSNRGAIGGSGGEAAHALTAAEGPVHGHGINDQGHSHLYAAIVQDAAGPLATGGTGTKVAQNNLSTNQVTTGITIQNAGSGTAHNNLPPMILCNFIMFVGS